MAKSMLLLLVLAFFAQTVPAFTNPSRLARSTESGSLFAKSVSSQSPVGRHEELENVSTRKPLLPSVVGFGTGSVGFIAQVLAADDYELAELPPPYVPAIFGVLLLAGIGVLTSSLGNVMDEEAGLGMQSGARAKKEIERSRSSYFGKRPK
mmetsp:Transcript_3995/g.10455  ORF Transcript_3995/g.10455 Transcript_3995/m.10455 type:complete len:151 (-) Transcript_3995:1321-1773(-)|eukprot:CAMPEP_0197190784 /NCGR_PEP_ID=MMETSP1423-20130617/22260_1 /TAXON_ID=476441 /ORGANISM="Pseudo-nitzschia heimii, Strain UNC1101" /LENGTH=150 /DNA_ID=CAMNT_0042643241 /DNA_START=80 /DNA_END=532 /DNA_ORIENTATION=-